MEFVLSLDKIRSMHAHSMDVLPILPRVFFVLIKSPQMSVVQKKV